MKLSILLITALGLALSACGSSKSETLGYSFELNGCKTGEHKLDSKDAYCQALKDEKLNNGCAYLLRKQDYEREGCPGKFDDSANAE